MSNQENEEFKIVQYKKRNTKNKFVKNEENDKEIQNLHKRIYSPKVDLIERESCYFIRIELPEFQTFCTSHSFIWLLVDVGISA